MSHSTTTPSARTGAPKTSVTFDSTDQKEIGAQWSARAPRDEISRMTLRSSASAWRFRRRRSSGEMLQANEFEHGVSPGDRGAGTHGGRSVTFPCVGRILPNVRAPTASVPRGRFALSCRRSPPSRGRARDRSVHWRWASAGCFRRETRDTRLHHAGSAARPRMP
jgi:hypothetical protein